MKKLKKHIRLILAAGALLLLSGCSGIQQGIQGVVELPSPIQLAILAGVTFVFGFILTKVAEAVPWLGEFLGRYVDEVSVAVAGSLVLAIQNALNAIPPEWKGVANAALALIVAVLAAVGLLKTARKARVPGFIAAKG